MGMMKALLPLVILMLLPAPVFSVPKVKRQQDYWAPWGEWGDCSRTCGGGVTFRERRCYSQRTDGGSSCVGPFKNFRSCNIQDCPEGARDFREEQCAQFDGTEFQGKRYRWLPYYGAPNKCELNCIPKGENFYYRHKEMVIDGTLCEPGKRDICVEGVCKPVGCDSMLESSQKEDKCLECGGDGRTCYDVRATFSIPDLPKGYNQIFIIPVGATSIHIKELVPSRNFLAIKNVRGEYYLNGHWTIEFSRALHIASTVLHYDRGAEGDLAPETIHGRGPTTEPLAIELISQEPNQGIQYEYYLPYRRQSQGYFWSYGSFSECSAECGGGYQSRLVFCTIDDEAYPDAMCGGKTRPMNNRTCNNQRCPQTKRMSYIYQPRGWLHSGYVTSRAYSWKTGQWGPCSTSCGGGSQSRSVYCVSYDGSGAQAVVDDAECAAFAEKPHSQQVCNLKHCATWIVGPWSQCSEACGEGVQTRTVSCGPDLGSSLLDFACLSQPKPPTTQSCTVQDCVQEISWHIGDWGLCSKSCGSGLRERQVICADNDRNFYGPERCNIRDRPPIVENCNTQPCFLPQQVPSMQDPRGYDNTRQSSLTRYIPGGFSTVYRNEWTERDGMPPQLRPDGNGSPNLSPLVPSQDRYGSRQELILASPRDCTQSVYGCCSDGQTPARGPGGHGCPPVPCQQMRYGCCADGITAAHGPNAAGCPQYYSDVYTGENEEATANLARTTTTQAPTRQTLSDECRVSTYGCCFDNSSPAAGPNGEGCLNKPSYPYPDICLLPNANGPCSNWIVRWYFVPSAGLCNRFWYGSCHGNKNNFHTEDECMRVCKTPSGHGRGSDITNSRQHKIPVHTEFVNREGKAAERTMEGYWQTHDSSSRHTFAGGKGLGQLSQSEVTQRHSPDIERGSSHWATGSRFDKVFPREGWRQDHHTEKISSGGSPSHWPSSTKTHLDQKQAMVQTDQSLARVPPPQTETGIFGDHQRQPVSTHSRTQVVTNRHAGLQESDHKHVFQTGETKSTHTVALDNRHFSRSGQRQASQTLSGSEVNIPGQDHVVPVPHDPTYAKQFTSRFNVDRADISTVEATPGQAIWLRCKVEGPAPITFEWKKDGRQISSVRHTYQSDGSLVISRVSTEDAGWYLCTASSQQQRDYRQVLLKIQEVTQPKQASQSHPHTTKEENRFLDRQNHRQTQTLFAEEDKRGSTAYSQASSSINQPPVYRLRLEKMDPSSVDVRPGQTVRLPCRADGSPTVTVEWQKDSKPIFSFRHTKQPDGTLVISKVNAEDAGWYICTASNGRDRDHRQVQLKVQAIYIRQSLSIVEARIGHSAQLLCPVEGFPRPKVHWERNGVHLAPSAKPRFSQLDDNSLQITSVMPSDAGEYVCIAGSNAEPVQRKVVELKVKGELRITSPPPNVEVTRGGSVHLPCVVSGTNVNVRWSRNGVPVRGDGGHIYISQDGSLILHNVQPADEGSYTCNAYSGAHSVSASAEVKVVKPKPEDHAAHVRDPTAECIDQPELANCDLIVQAKLCTNEYYSSFCCASCSQYQPLSRSHTQQG